MSIAEKTTTTTTMATEAPPVVDGLHAVVADILSNLYGHVEEAVIREYVSNGIDATNAAGSNAFVELSLPDPFQQNLVIQDFGTGMSPHEASVHWATYGNSTKVDDPDFIGNIGAGAKAGFAVSTMILMETTKNGITTSFNYTWFEGAGPQKVGETIEETDKPNGTTITIPVDPSRDWEGAAKRALLYTGSRVKIDGEVLTDPRGENAPMIHRMTREHDEIQTMHTSRIVMAGANFRVPDIVLNAVEEVCIPISGYMGNVAIEVPNKSLEHTPSREHIKDTPANVEALKAVLTEQFGIPFNKQYLGKTPWETYRNIRKTHEWGYLVDCITPEVKAHLDTVNDFLNDEQETHGTVGITYVNGSRETWSGKPIRSAKRYSTHQQTVVDGMVTAQAGAQTMMFVYSADGKVTRSPKVRQWILDQKTHDCIVIVVQDAKHFEQIEAAGFDTMTEEAMRKYKPKNHIPSAKQTSIQYAVRDLYERRGYYGSENKMGATQIAEHYDAIFVLGHNDLLPSASHLTFEQNVELFKASFGDQRIAVIKLSAQASRKLAVERIGLPEVDVQEVVEAFNANAVDVLPKRYSRLIHMLHNLSHWGFYSRKPESLKSLVSTKAQQDSMYSDSMVIPIRELLGIADSVLELTGLEEPAVIAELRTVYQELTETNWVDEMLELFAEEEHLLTEEQRLALAIERALKANDEPIISRAAQRLVRDHRNDLQQNIKTVSGVIVAEAYSQVIDSGEADQQEQVA